MQTESKLINLINANEQLEFFKALAGYLLKKQGGHLIINPGDVDHRQGTIMHRYKDGQLEVKIVDDIDIIN